MSEKKVRVINELLNEEKWTRATLNSYTINNFKELDTLIEETIDSESQDEIKELCDEHLHHTKNSIIALYISGILSLRIQLIDDSNLVKLISIFSDNHKWNIVEFLCNRILEFGENKYALRTLAECYRHENEEEKMYSVWERLIKVDYEEADIVKQIAQRKEEEEKIEEAVDYYKKAIYRYINKKLFASVKDIWHKLIAYVPEEVDFFFNLDSKIEKTISPDRAAQLLEELYEYYHDQKDWNRSIEIVKRILNYDSKNEWARKEILDCYKEKYSYHSHLEEYIRLSNLTQSWRNVHDAIGDFEKHISFDAGNFVCHRSWGIGLISGIKDDEITIDFSRKRGHKMSLKMAVNALNILAKDHIWVLKVIMKKDELKQKVKKDIPWALKTVIKSFDNAADMKKIKNELVPSILTQGEWSSWSTEARKVLKTNQDFGHLPDKVDFYMVRENPISYEEKVFNKFKAEKSFFNRVQTLREFLRNSDPDSDFFAEMVDYFVNFLRAFNVVNEQIIASYLLITDLVKDHPYLNPGLDLSFPELIEETNNLEETFAKIEDTELKKIFLAEVKKHLSDWGDVYTRLFPAYLTKYIIDELKEHYPEKLRTLFNDIVENSRDYRESFIWLAKNHDQKWFECWDIKYEKILIGMIHLLDVTFREIDNRRDVSNNRKLNRQIQGFLFKDRNLEKYLLESDEDSVNRLLTLVEDVKDLDPSIKIELRHKIIEKFPNFKLISNKEQINKTQGLIVTKSSFERKKKELQHIIDVEIPENSKEIGAAIELGDLRENAEYKAAKERQDILNNNVSKLNDEIEKAQIFEKDKVDTTKISFGTTVLFTNKDEQKEEKYTILGPWESEPKKYIISYLSPLGSELLNHKVGENLHFVINDREYNLRIEDITEADF